MGNKSRIIESPPAAVEDALRRLGRQIRIARVRRKLRIEDLANKIGSSRFTVSDVEKGKGGTSAAAYVGVLWALGMIDQVNKLADPDGDEEGKILESARQPRQAPRRRSFDNDF